MEARIKRAALLAAFIVAGCVQVSTAGNRFGIGQTSGSSHRTRHFVVTAPTPEIAKAVAEQAEVYRRDLAVEWLGRELPEWSQPCPHHRAGRQYGRWRGDQLHVRPRPALRVADVGPRHLPAHHGQRTAARGHAHHLRHALRPAATPLGRRGRLHDRRASEREKQTARQPGPVSANESRHRVQSHVRHEGIPQGRSAALRSGLLPSRAI